MGTCMTACLLKSEENSVGSWELENLFLVASYYQLLRTCTVCTRLKLAIHILLLFIMYTLPCVWSLFTGNSFKAFLGSTGRLLVGLHFVVFRVKFRLPNSINKSFDTKSEALIRLSLPKNVYFSLTRSVLWWLWCQTHHDNLISWQTASSRT